MMQKNFKIKATQILQIHNDDTNETEYLIEKDGEWVKITEDKYEQIRGKVC